MSRRPAALTTAHALVWGAASLGSTVLAYLLILGWNATKHLTPEEPGSVGMECAGPYDTRQVLTLGLVLAALVVVGMWWQQYVVPVACVSTVTVLFTVDAVTVHDPCADNLALLPVGVAVLLLGAATMTAVLSVVTVAIRKRTLGA